MKEEKYFSVIMPVYNGMKFLRETLNSVAGQTLGDYEIVIANDGSTDASETVISEFTAEHPEIKVIYVKQANKGLGGARNTAIKNGRGRFLALLDQDDLWYPEKLEKVRRILENDREIDVIVHDEDILRNDGIAGVYRYGTEEKDLFRSLLFRKNCLSTSSVVLKRGVAEANGLFSEDREKLHFTEDFDLWLKIAAAGGRFKFIKDRLGASRLHAGNFSSDNELMQRHTIRVIEDHYAGYKRKRPLDFIRYRKRMAALNAGVMANSLRHKNYGKAWEYLKRSFRDYPLFFCDLAVKAVIK